MLFARRLTLALAALSAGLTRPAMAEPDDGLRISVLTFGPGDHPFARFGHNALLVQDTTTREDKVYNYGTYDFSSPTLVRDFLAERPRYWLSVGTLAGTLRSYRAQNRSITAQELALPKAERQRLALRLEHDALPANRYYRYDYYGDNCSTRVRDLVDEALGGRLREVTQEPARLTYRGHTARLVADTPLVLFGLDFALASAVDRSITEWDEMFLPESLAASLRRARRPAGAGEGSAVARETVLHEARRPPSAALPPDRRAGSLALGSLAGASLALLGRAARMNRAALFLFLLIVAALCLATGLLGALLAFLWAATDHVVAHRNENLLQLSPLGLLAAPLSIAAGWAGQRVRRGLGSLLWLLALLSLAGLLAKLLPGFGQENGAVTALALPLWVGAALGAHAFARPPS